jgi:hypothetical protein
MLFTKKSEFRPLEKDVQHSIVQTLRVAGAYVKETTAYKQKGSSGVDLGIPDLLVSHPSRRLIYLGIEVKRDEKAARTQLSPSQALALQNGEYNVVWTPVQALDCYIGFLQRSYPDEDTTSALGKALSVKQSFVGEPSDE